MLVIVGVPGNERVVGLVAACDRIGLATRVVAWSDALDDPASVTLGSGDVLRVDSPADDRALRARLAGAAPSPDGAWTPGRPWFAGLERALRALPSGTHPADTVLAMTDKLACRERLAAAGLPIPEGGAAPSTPAGLRDWMDERRWSQAFVKARWGSSGAGVFAWRRDRRGERELAYTTLRVEDGSLYLCKRVERVVGHAEIDERMGPVLADGAVVERWVPKLGWQDRSVDLRVVVVDGVPAICVARAARGPVTNLHLDAERIDPSSFLSATALRDVDDLARKIAAVFPGHRCFGADILVDVHGRLWVCEVNAWGDNVRRVDRDGLSVWDIQARALACR